MVIEKAFTGDKMIAENVTSTWPIAAIKSKIVCDWDIPYNQQQLIYGGTMLESGKDLADYNIPLQSTIHLVVVSKEDSDEDDPWEEIHGSQVIKRRHHYVTYGGGPEGGFVYSYGSWHSWNREWFEPPTYTKLDGELVADESGNFLKEVPVDYQLADGEDWLSKEYCNLMSESDEEDEENEDEEEENNEDFNKT